MYPAGHGACSFAKGFGQCVPKDRGLSLRVGVLPILLLVKIDVLLIVLRLIVL